MRLAVAVLLMALLGSCANKAEKDILSPQKMTDVVWDLIRVDEFASGFLSKDSSLVLKTERQKMYKDVFRLHQVSQQRFSVSYKYYAAHPDLMKVIFDSLTTKGERERKKLYLPKDSVAK